MNRRGFISLAVPTSLAAVFLGGYTVFGERYSVQFNRYRIMVPHLPDAFNGVRIVHLTDIHYGYLMSISFVKKLLKKVQLLDKDMIFCTGDYIHERDSSDQIDIIWPELCKLKAPLGVYNVLGNHDHWGSTQRSMYWLNRSGQNVQRSEKCLEKNGQRLWIAGAGDFLEDHFDLDKVLEKIPETDCRIVLAHNPDTADSFFKSRIDLMVSGHTHGGQVSIPFAGPPVLPVMNKTYSSGLKISPKNHKVFISRGIGWAICPVRFNCAPEIVILELVTA